MGALKFHRRDDIRRLKDEARPLAKMGAYLLMAQGVKKAQTEWINDWEFIERAIEIRAFIPKQVGKVYTELYESGRLARWVVDCTDPEVFEIASK